MILFIFTISTCMNQFLQILIRNTHFHTSFPDILMRHIYQIIPEPPPSLSNLHNRCISIGKNIYLCNLIINKICLEATL